MMGCQTDLPSLDSKRVFMSRFRGYSLKSASNQTVTVESCRESNHKRESFKAEDTLSKGEQTLSRSKWLGGAF